ncbi:hypothetical protein BRC91_09925 [Halobacteriales archaeon QS_4_62_28]|nr:MAG: hypothetical protein BRC91_09925 [Halobacteriales archaeon QS_4_62_28]
MDRAQLPVSLLEAALGVVVILGIALGFALGVPAPPTREPQLDAYAEDAVTLLATEPPQHRNTTRLTEIVASEGAFQREQGTIRDRTDRILPDNVMFRVETPHGAVGIPRPGGITTGTATVTTVEGPVTIRVWYA